jgi:hypothetical protein
MRTRREKKQELAICIQIHPQFSCEEGIEKKKTAEITGFIRITTRRSNYGLPQRIF